MSQNYTCCACGYETNKKCNIQHHFYNRKKPCPLKNQGIMLTDEIREYILHNRAYHPHVNQHSINMANNTNSTINANTNINNTINNYNTINAFITSLDTVDKLTTYVEHIGKSIKPFEDMVEEKYRKNVCRLEADRYKYGFELDTDALLDIIDEVSQVSSEQIEDMNVIGDTTGKVIKLYDGEWKCLRYKCAMKTMIQTIKQCYLDRYEVYLLKKIKNPDILPKEKQRCNELLNEYYQFLACTDVRPFVPFAEDGECHEFDETVQDEYMERFKKIRDDTKLGVKNKTQSEVIDIVIRNSKKNVSDLNKRIVNMFQMDEEFKNSIMDIIQPISS